MKVFYDADFRFRMIRIRENAEGVALSGGASDEALQLRAAFGKIWRTWWRLMTPPTTDAPSRNPLDRGRGLTSYRASGPERAG